MKTLTKLSATAVAAVLAISAAACAPDMTRPVPKAVARDLVATEIELPVSGDDFTEADQNQNGTICGKQAPSGELLLRDDNLNTPSQLCPPSFELIGKGKGVKGTKESFEEDANRNGVVCVKVINTTRSIVKDDDLNTPSQPCPPSYAVVTSGKTPGTKGVSAELLALADDNDNGQICLRYNENTGNYQLKDDDLNLPSQPCPPSYSLETSGKKGGGKDDPAPPAEPGKP